MARPLTDLTKKNNFQWGSEAEQAFIVLKQAVTSSPVLAYPNFNLPFEIECDASGKGVDVVLMQQKKPIAFFSKAISGSNLNKSVYEKELMALVLAIHHWRHYLLGRKFLVHTDQKSLKHLLEQRITTSDQQCWMAKLMGFHFDIVYKPGRENRAADALSRIHEEAELKTIISTPVWLQGRDVYDEVHKDPALQKLISDLQNNPTAHPGYSLHTGVLLYKGRLVIPSNSPIIPTLLQEFHSSPTGGHSGFLRTYRRLAGNLYWVGMKKVIMEFVRSCATCQRQKYMAASPSGLLQPLPIPKQVWEDISMDFITGLPKSKGFDAVLVVVDRLSKYGHFILLKHPYNACSVAALFAREVVKLHGIPQSILSDRDPLFVSNFWKELFKLQGTVLKMSSSYHPETDGQTEVVNRCLEAYLRCFASEQPKTWSYWLPWAELWYNTTFHVSTGTTPFQVVYGRPPPTITRFMEGETKVEAVARELQERDEALAQLKYHLSKAQE